MLVYATHTDTKDIAGRMDDILTRHGFRVTVIKSDAVVPDNREAWVEDKVKRGIDVLICHPRLVRRAWTSSKLPAPLSVRDRLRGLRHAWA